MSNIVKRLITDGPKKAMLSVYLQSDGVEGELTNFVILDPKVDFTQQTINTMSVLQVWYSFSWFDTLLSFDDLVPPSCWLLARDTGNYADFRYFGGLKDQSGIDQSGKLLITTSGFAPIGSIGTLIIELKKD